jgi:hypothetical protein
VTPGGNHHEATPETSLPRCANFVHTPLRLACALSSPGDRSFQAFSPAQQVARIIRVEPLLSRLSSLSATKTPAATGLSLEEMSLHQQITEAVVVASLDVDHVVDQIDNERAQMVEPQSILLAP